MENTITTPSPDDFDIEALSAAYEAFFDAPTGGNYGGIRAAIKTYNEVAARSRIIRLAERHGLAVIASVAVDSARAS